MDPSFPPILASLVALLVGILSFIGARAQIKISRDSALEQIRSAHYLEEQRIKSEVFTKYFQTWADKLRTELVEFCSLCDPDSDAVWANRHGERLSQIVTLTYRIELLLSGEGHERELVTAIGSLAAHMSIVGPTLTQRERLVLSGKIVRIGRIVLTDKIKGLVSGYEDQATRVTHASEFSDAP